MRDRKYDLEERILIFNSKLLKFASKISITCFNKNLIYQLIKSATSIGANYVEANGAESKKDFTHKIAIAKKEAKEAHYWLKLLYEYDRSFGQECLFLMQEVHEFILIFSKIVITIKRTEKNKNLEPENVNLS